jgi:hypothetical protein
LEEALASFPDGPQEGQSSKHNIVADILLGVPHKTEIPNFCLDEAAEKAEAASKKRSSISSRTGNFRFEQTSENVTPRTSRNIDEIIDRLSRSKKSTKPEQNPQPPPKRRYKRRIRTGDESIFDELFRNSQERLVKNQEAIRKHERDEMRVASAPKGNERSRRLASKSLHSRVKEVLSPCGSRFISESQILEIMQKLGLLEPGQTFTAVPVLDTKKREWQTELTIDDCEQYDLNLAAESIRNALDTKRPTKFDIFARRMIAVKFPTVHKSRTEKEDVNCSHSEEKTICKIDTLNRLSEANQKPEKPRRYRWIKRGETQKPKPKTYEEPERLKMSEQTKQLLSKMEFARRSFLDRDAIVWLEREEKRRDLEEEMYGIRGKFS